MGGWNLDNDMPQLTHPLPRKQQCHFTPFKRGQKVVVSNDKVILRAVVQEPQFNIYCEEILRPVAWGCEVRIEPQEDFEAFKFDMGLSFTYRYINICHNKGVWIGEVYSMSTRPEYIELILRQY